MAKAKSCKGSILYIFIFLSELEARQQAYLWRFARPSGNGVVGWGTTDSQRELEKGKTTELRDFIYSMIFFLFFFDEINCKLTSNGELNTFSLLVS